MANFQTSNPPTLQPSNPPTLQTSNPPTLQTSNPPTLQPSKLPTLQPSKLPTLAMIGTLQIAVSAARPDFPLRPIHAFVGSAVSLVIQDVPRPFGVRTITGVTVTAKGATGSATAFAATAVGNDWSVTIPASFFAATGTVERGIVISAAGKDETGAAVSNWTLGVADLVVMPIDGSVAPGESYQVMRWHDTRPASPIKGDVAPYQGQLYWWNGSAWTSFGGGSDGTAVHYTADAGKTDAEKAQARTNIGAANATHEHAQSDVTGLAGALAAKYEKPDLGIPKIDLEYDVISSLEKADTALQEHQDVSGKRGVLDLAVYSSEPANQHWSWSIDETVYSDLNALLAQLKSTNSKPSWDSEREMWHFPLPCPSGWELEENEQPGHEGLSIAFSFIKDEIALSVLITASRTSSSDTTLVPIGPTSDTLAKKSEVPANPATSFAAVGGVTPTIVSGEAQLTDLFAKSDSFATDHNLKNSVLQGAVNSLAHYTFSAASATLSDRAINAVTVTSAAVSLAFPAATNEGTARDFLILVDASGYAEGGSLSITLPTGATQYGDDFPAVTAAGKHLVTVTEIAANAFYVRSIELEEVE